MNTKQRDGVNFELERPSEQCAYDLFVNKVKPITCRKQRFVAELTSSMMDSEFMWFTSTIGLSKNVATLFFTYMCNVKFNLAHAYVLIAPLVLQTFMSWEEF